MKNKKALQYTDSLIKEYIDFRSARYKKLGEDKFDRIYHNWDVNSWYGLRNLFFNLITNESNFDDFYDRFDAPGTTRGYKPIAWGERFIPDLINDQIWDTEITLEDKVKQVKKLYKKCVELEKDFKPKPTKA